MNESEICIWCTLFYYLGPPHMLCILTLWPQFQNLISLLPPTQTRGSQVNILAPLAMSLWTGLFGLPGLTVYQLWGTLANVPKVKSVWSPALFFSCLSDLHYLWAYTSGTLSRNQKAQKTAPCVQLEKTWNLFNKGFVNWFLELLSISFPTF